MGRKPKRHLSKKETDSQNVCEEMLSFTCHQENANQNHDEISCHICYYNYYQKPTNKQKQQVMARMWRKSNPCALLVGIKSSATTKENRMEVLQKIKNNAILLRNSISGNLSKENENINSKRYMHTPCSLQLLFTIVEI